MFDIKIELLKKKRACKLNSGKFIPHALTAVKYAIAQSRIDGDGGWFHKVGRRIMPADEWTAIDLTTFNEVYPYIDINVHYDADLTEKPNLAREGKKRVFMTGYPVYQHDNTLKADYNTVLFCYQINIEEIDSLLGPGRW